jgi:hypothetical protein
VLQSNLIDLCQGSRQKFTQRVADAVGEGSACYWPVNTNFPDTSGRVVRYFVAAGEGITI